MFFRLLKHVRDIPKRATAAAAARVAASARLRTALRRWPLTRQRPTLTAAMAASGALQAPALRMGARLWSFLLIFDA